MRVTYLLRKRGGKRSKNKQISRLDYIAMQQFSYFFGNRRDAPARIGSSLKVFAQNRWVVVGLLWTCSLWATNASDTFVEASQKVQSGNYGKARELLSNLTETYPLKSLYWFNLGQVEYALGHYAQAVNAYRTVITLKSALTPAAELYLARSYSKLGKNKRARQILEGLNRKSLPSNLKMEVELDLLSQDQPKLRTAIRSLRERDYARVIEETADLENQVAGYHVLRAIALLAVRRVEEARSQLSEQQTHKMRESPLSTQAQKLSEKLEEIKSSGPWHASVGLSSLYHSNLFGDGASEARLQKPGLQIASGLAYSFPKVSDVKLTGIYQIYLEEYYQASSARYFKQTLNFVFDYLELQPYSVKLTPYIDWLVVGSDSFVYQGGLQAQLSKELEAGQLEGALSIQKNIPGHSYYEYMRGAVYQTYVGYVYKDIINFGLRYHYQRNLTGDLEIGTQILPLRGSVHGPELVLSKALKSFGWRFSLQFQDLSFDTIDPSSNKNRSDTRLSTQFDLSYRMSRTQTGQLLLGWVDNSSNFGAGDADDRSFQQFWAKVGLIWELL